ncbi:hypothetical protein D7M11_19075 [Paenibacillus ginsengarvi]|uniref:Uncharacterized protein n=1 Tax=Paenibacillus ginsengarvi TaxID=400777 RepID=A0A3B0C8H7_9BACL|nr:hypothetical protein D7M11_19075 [Paenibacillus ginsengarvi]
MKNTGIMGVYSEEKKCRNPARVSDTVILNSSFFAMVLHPMTEYFYLLCLCFVGYASYESFRFYY